MQRLQAAGFFLSACLLATAQDAVHLASVSGRVTDPSGAVVEGATVTARQTETNQKRESVTDHEGRFRLPYLKVGPYEVTVSHTGFTETSRILTLTAGAAYELALPLTVSAAQSQIEVTGQSGVLETAR